MIIWANGLNCETLNLAQGASGAVSGFLSSGAADAASALSSRAADEAVSTTTEAAATTADSSGREAAEDAASRSGGEEPAQSQKSESCLVGGQSFTAGTKVLTASGAVVAISRLKPGDKVLATNTKTGKTQAERVAAVLVHYDQDRYDLKVRAAGHTSIIHTTRSHLFWNQTTRRWTKAAALKYGTHLRTPTGGTATVVGGWTPKVTTGWMWDLTIPTDHDFYIQAAASTVLAHNENSVSCGAAAEESRDGAQAADDGIRSFAHGTSPHSAADIAEHGLSESAARAQAGGGLYDTPGSFHTAQIDPANPSDALDTAMGYGFTKSATPNVVVSELPESVFQDMLGRGVVSIEKVPGLGEQTVFSPESYDLFNRYSNRYVINPYG